MRELPSVKQHIENRRREAARSLFVADMGQRVCQDARGLIDEIKAVEDRRSFLTGLQHLRLGVNALSAAVDYRQSACGPLSPWDDTIESLRHSIRRASTETRLSYIQAFLSGAQNEVAALALRFRLWERTIKADFGELLDTENQAQEA